MMRDMLLFIGCLIISFLLLRNWDIQHSLFKQKMKEMDKDE